jgi:hypothetical protein
MNYNVIIDKFNNRAIAFCNDNLDIPDTYLVFDIEYDVSILGKRYNNGNWEEVPTPISEQDKFKSAYAIGLSRV